MTPASLIPRLPLQARAARMSWLRMPVVYFIEFITIVFSALIAFLLRFDFVVPGLYVHIMFAATAVWLPVKLLAFGLLGLDRRWARYVSFADLTRLALSNLIGSFVSFLILVVISVGVPRSVFAIDFLLCVILSSGTRAFGRLAFEMAQVRSGPTQCKRAIIYGAGNAGAALVRELRRGTSHTYDLCGLVDDSPQKRGLILHGVKVLGAGSDLPDIVAKVPVDLVLIAAPSATGEQMTQILEHCHAAGLRYKTIPGVAELLSDTGLARQIRDVAVEDLLGRRPVNLDQDRLQDRLAGRVILVTGAAGSIGSEICRQLARFLPAAIIGFEVGESPLFNLQLEMQRNYPAVRFEAEIGSIQNVRRLEEVFTKHRPSAVYHAAAYKHVPLMESHIFEAVENNIFGTLNVSATARRFGVEEFVMISTDKAVRPTNMMGATKRIAEMVVRCVQPAGAKYLSVRFGNVLGSNGSVVPIFKEQIARGGPVTVTHPEMRRYFMTIPEACQLVLQASTMGKGGEIFVLNMGDPVRIVDLARNLILLSGFRPEHDIKIHFSGVRPGEKLYEEINANDEGLLPTHHQKIHVFSSTSRSWPDVEACLDDLRECCARRHSDELVMLVRNLVPDYSPAPALLSGTISSVV